MARIEGMKSTTKATCLADGAENCWSIAHSIEKICNITFVLDWFHVSMKFKNIAIPDDNKDLYAKVKWHLWHGKVDTALIRLTHLIAITEDNSTTTTTTTKLNKLATYIENNKERVALPRDRFWPSMYKIDSPTREAKRPRPSCVRHVALNAQAYASHK